MCRWRSPYCLNVCFNFFDLISIVFSSNGAEEILVSYAFSKILALNSSAARLPSFLPSFLASRSWEEARDQEEPKLPVEFNEFARRRERVRNCWRSEKVREFYFSDVGRVLVVRQVGDSHQIERWTLRIRNPLLLSVFSSGEVCFARSAPIMKRYFLIKQLKSSRNRSGRRKRARLQQIFLSPLSIVWRRVSFWIDYPLKRRIPWHGKVRLHLIKVSSNTAWLTNLGDKFRECVRINFLSEKF